MLYQFRLFCLVLLLPALIPFAAWAQPVGNTFTYQGELRDGGTAANGTYDLRFKLFDAFSNGAQVGPLLCVDNVLVNQGTFTVELDFGAVFAGSTRYIEIDVRPDTGLGCISGAGFTILSPRQRIVTTPYSAYSLAAATATTAASALTAANSTNLNGQPASFFTNAANLTGALSDARLSTNVTLLSGPQAFSGTKTFNSSPVFAASGAPFSVSSTTKVTGLNADLLDGIDSSGFASVTHTHNANAIVSGTLADARLSSNVPRLDSANVFTGTNRFNAFTGVNRATPLTNNEVFGLQNVSGGTGFVGMYITSTDTSSGRPFYGYGVNGLSAWTYVEPGGQWRLDNGGDRLAVTRSTGNVGIGTTTPTSRLEVVSADAAIRFRNTNDQGGGFMQNTFSMVQLGMYNPTGILWGTVPANGTRAMLGLENTGRVGTLRNTTGSPIWRNTLDDGAGNATFQGNIAANNMPAIKFASSAGSGYFKNNSVTLIENITVNVPATGYIRITARASIFLSAYDFSNSTATLELKETTSGEIVIKDTDLGIGDGTATPSGANWQGDITLEHSFATGPGTRSFKLRLLHSSLNSLNGVSYTGSEITVMYYPAGL